MRITPATHVLESLRSQSLGWSKALAELIDNAVDAGAVNVTVTSELAKLAITDDGVGCSDMQAMFRLGDHRPHGTKGLGRFGIGLKDAALWMWGTTTIQSTRAGKTYRAQVIWDALKKSQDWEVDDPTIQATPNDPSGTRIVFSRIERRMPSGKDFEGLVAELGFIFAPALRRGLRLVFRRDRVQPIECRRFETPPLEHEVDGDIEVQGRRAHVHAGVVPEGTANPHAGLHYTHRHRVIIPSSGLGCNGYSTARLFGWVSLTDQWRLSKNKDEVTQLRDELGQAVYQFIQPVLAHASRQADSLALAGLEAELSEMLRETLGQREKEHREQGEAEGAKEPKESGRKRGAIKRQPGNRLPGHINAGKLRVEFEALSERDGIGVVDIHGNRVRLAVNHPYIAHLRTTTQRAALFQIALSLLLHHCVINPDDVQAAWPWRRGESEDVQFSALLSHCLTGAAGW